MRNPDRMIGKVFGVRNGIELKAVRSINFHLYRSAPSHELELRNRRLVFTTDQGRFYGTDFFIGSDTFNIINLHLIDIENQLVCSGEDHHRFPIPVSPGKEILLSNYRI